MSVSAAAGGTGKTALVVTEALAFVSGRDLLDDHLRASGKAWYIGLEDPLDEYQRRFVAAAIFYKIDPHVIASGLFLDSGRTQNFVIASEGPEGTQIAKPIVGAIIENIRRNNISLVVVDPFIDSHDVNENNNGAINAVAREWAYIAEETGAAVEVIHHLRKGTAGQEPTADDVRGARALIDKSRSTRLLIPMTAKEALEVGNLAA